MDEEEASNSHSVSSWMPSPPPKRRRINHRIPLPQPQPQPPTISPPPHAGSILRSEKRNISPSRELAKPLFGIYSKLSSIDAVTERRAIIELLDDYKADEQHTLAIEFRLTNLSKTVE